MPYRGPRCVCHAHGMSEPKCRARQSTLPQNGSGSKRSPSVKLRDNIRCARKTSGKVGGWGAGRGPGSRSRRVTGSPKLTHQAFAGNINSHRGPPWPPASFAHSEGPTTVDGSQQHGSRKYIHPKEKTRASCKDQQYSISTSNPASKHEVSTYFSSLSRVTMMTSRSLEWDRHQPPSAKLHVRTAMHSTQHTGKML